MEPLYSGEKEKFQKLLEDLKLDQYHDNFLHEQVLHSDLDGISEEDLLEIIPKRIHRRRLLKHLNSPKEEEREGDPEPKFEKSASKRNEEEVVQMLVKCEQEVENVCDVPVDSSNEELITKLLQTFLMNKCKVKLQDENRELASGMKSFTLRKWLDKNDRSVEDEIRAVLNVKWPKAEKSSLEFQKLEETVKELRTEKQMILAKNAKLEEKLLQKGQKNEELQKEIENLRGEGKCGVSAKKLELAHNCLWGLNGERIDNFKPHKLYEEIVNSGGKLDGNANFNLGHMYKWGYGVNKDKTKSKEYYKKAAEFYSTKKVDDLKPNDWGNMGWMYVWGDGFDKNQKKGVELLKKAVERGNLVAMNNLGICYRRGLGVEKSYSEAVKLYSKAVEMRLLEAINDLGFMYDNGYGVKKDEKKALELFREAAEKGERIAMSNVGLFYNNGIGGVEKNLEEAKKWYKRASKLGNERAGKELEELEKLSPSKREGEEVEEEEEEREKEGEEEEEEEEEREGGGGEGFFAWFRNLGRK